MKARIVSVENQDKGKYNSLKVTFRNLDTDKVLSSYVLSYTFPDVFATMKNAEVDSVWDIKVAKNDKDFWDWVSAKPLNETDAVEAPSHKKVAYGKNTGAQANTAGRDFESKAERAIRQVLIVRQSSVTAALQLPHPHGLEDVLTTAAAVENWVFRGKLAQEVNKLGIQGIMELDSDIPY